MSDATERDPHAQPEPPYGQPDAPGPAQPPYAPHPYGPPAGQPYGYPGYGQPGPAQGGSGKRPATVTAAGVITLVSAAASLVMFVLAVVVLLVAPDTVAREMRTTPGFENVDPNDVVTVVVVMMVVLALWCVGAMVLAIFAMRRVNGARIGLVVSAAIAALISLVSIASIVSVATLLASIATIVCLFTGGANAWYAGRDGAGQQGVVRGPVA